MYDRRWRPEEDRESDDAIRAADADREATAETLRKHHAAGRLTDDEFQQRLEQSMSAKTLGELRELVADLPADRPTRERHSRWHRPPLGARLLPLFVALALIFGSSWRHAAWYGSGPRFGFPWPLLVLAVVGFALLRGRARCRASYYGRTWHM
jgi:hypothetical protein